MKPVAIDFPAISTSTLFSGTAVNLPAGSQLLLNGTQTTNIFTGATQYEYKFAPGVLVAPLLVNPSGINYSTVTFTVTGETPFGAPVEQVLLGPAAGASLKLTEYFYKITSITANAVIQPGFTIGLSGTGTILIQTDYWNKEALYTLQIANTVQNASGPDIDLSYTCYPPYEFDYGTYTPTDKEIFKDSFVAVPVDGNNVTTSPDPLTFPISANAAVSLTGIPVRGFAANVTSGTTYTVNTGSFTLMFMQQGAQF